MELLKFTISDRSSVTVETDGAAGDTEMWLYGPNSSLNQVEFDDDDGNGSFSKIERRGLGVLVPGTYYVKVGEYGNNGTIDSYTLRVVVRGFNIGLDLSGLTPSQETIVREGAARWEQVIIGGLIDVPYNGRDIDDVLIDFSAAWIDGPGNILGQGGPTVLRIGSYLPCAGMIQLDRDDIPVFEASGELRDIVIHEMAHVLGFGTIWTYLNLIINDYTGSTNPLYTGTRATAEYNSIFGVSETSVPLEFNFGPGTDFSHWLEDLFETELMTGIADPGAMPLSRVTVASMADLGYQVDMSAADPFSAPTPAPLARSVKQGAVRSFKQRGSVGQDAILSFVGQDSILSAVGQGSILPSPTRRATLPPSGQDAILSYLPTVNRISAPQPRGDALGTRSWRQFHDPDAVQDLVSLRAAVTRGLRDPRWRVVDLALTAEVQW